jgi:hypothetical protein
LTEHLNRQVTEDHTWDENLACSIFSAQALAKISEDGWEKPANFVRSSWAVDDSNRFPVPTDEATKERRDFDHIQERMKKEDAERAPKTIRYPAEKIEPVRFHRTWILGLLLGFEAYAPDGRQGRINTLKQMASAASDPTGWFYPPRAPWSTARVVMGLTAAGENIHSSETVKRACRWLRTPSPEGPFDKDRGIWESGTGTWNTEIETTAMCIIALVKAGVSIDDPTIEQGMEYILDNRDQWTSEGNEVDAVLAIKAHQLVRHNWMNIEDEFYDLINWVERTDRWVEAKTTEEDLDKESYKIPFIADTLIGIIWETLKNELPLLLNSLEPHNSKSDSESDNKGAKKRQVIHEVIKEIENRINRQIEIRRNTLNNSDAHLSSVNDEITHWENKKDQLRDIKIRFNNTTNTTEIPSKLVNDLDELARDCYSNNWTEIEEQIDTDS